MEHLLPVLTRGVAPPAAVVPRGDANSRARSSLATCTTVQVPVSVTTTPHNLFAGGSPQLPVTHTTNPSKDHQLDPMPESHRRSPSVPRLRSSTPVASFERAQNRRLVRVLFGLMKTLTATPQPRPHAAYEADGDGDCIQWSGGPYDRQLSLADWHIVRFHRATKGFATASIPTQNGFRWVPRCDHRGSHSRTLLTFLDD